MEGVAGLVLVLHRGLRQVCTRNELITKPSSRQMPTKTLLSALSQSPCPSFLEGEMLNALIMWGSAHSPLFRDSVWIFCVPTTGGRCQKRGDVGTGRGLYFYLKLLAALKACGTLVPPPVIPPPPPALEGSLNCWTAVEDPICYCCLLLESFPLQHLTTETNWESRGRTV